MVTHHQQAFDTQVYYSTSITYHIFETGFTSGFTVCVQSIHSSVFINTSKINVIDDYLDRIVIHYSHVIWIQLTTKIYTHYQMNHHFLYSDAIIFIIIYLCE